MVGSIITFFVVITIILVVLKILKKSYKVIGGVLVNALVGFIILFVLRAVGVPVEITWLSSLIVGLAGIPGLVLVLLLQFGLGIK